MPRLLKPFDYLGPKTVREAIQIISEYGRKAEVLAGGTDLVISMRKRQISPQYIVNMKDIPGLDYIHGYNRR